MRKLFNLLRGTRARLETDLDRELRYHVDRRAADLMATGVGEREAQRQAWVEFGGAAQVQEDVRETWVWRSFDEVARDVRFALRGLSKSWTFTLGAGAVLAIGIAANTAVFSVVNSVLLQPLGYRDGERIVTIETLWTNTGRVERDVSGADFVDWQSTGVFEALGHADGEDDMATVVSDRAMFTSQRTVSGSFFDVFGLPPAAGRLLTSQDDVSSPPPVAVVSHQWAETNFGSAQAAVGQRFHLFGASLQIVGVAAPGFRYPDGVDIWLPNGGTNRTNRASHPYQAVGKLARGMTPADAQVRLCALGERLAAQYPESRFKNFVVTPLRDRVTGGIQATLWILMAAVVLVLLIGCANIGNLLLARSVARGREIALRTALGAGRGRVVRQLLTESFVLSIVSAAAGVLLARVLVNALVALAPENLPRVSEIRIDTTVLMFSLGLSIAATLLFGLLPALHVSRLNLSDALKLGGAKTTAGTGARLRSGLVVLEVALSVMLLAGAGLLLRSFQLLNRVDLGFNAEGVVVAQTQAVPAPGPDGRRLRALFYRDFVARLRTIPGVDAAAGVSVLPLGRETVQGAEYFVEGRPEGLPGERPRTETKSISSGFFETLRIPLSAGRDFNDGDMPDRPRVVIVSETLARTSFPGESPIGRRIKLGTGGPWLDIVGVVGDTRWIDPSLRPAAQVYTPSLQGGGSLTILVRGAGGASTLGATIRQLMQEMNKNVPIRLDTMDELFSNAVAHARFRARLIGTFGAMALLLAAVGIFSVLAYLVGQRTRELAVRRAVGASAGNVIRLIVGRGAKLIAIGLALGLAGALTVARALEAVLYEISPWDVASYLGAVGMLGLVAMMATILPAARAATIDPVIALRQE